MPVLLRDPEQILSQHELPGHRGMPGVVGSAPSKVGVLHLLMARGVEMDVSPPT